MIHENVFYDLMESSNLLELADKLEVFLKYMKSQHNDNNLYEAFYKELLFSTSFSNEPYQVFQNEDIAAPYLLSNWFLCDSGKDNYAFFEQILHMTRQQFSSSNATGARIAAEKIPELMDLVEQKFGYVSNVLKDRRLPILIVDEICTSGNSVTIGNCIIGVDDKLSQPKDIVIASRMKDDTAPEFAFLHELGHILHIRLTHQYRDWEPPKSFDVIQQHMFKRLAGRPKQLWAECFADCFAISALYGTEYANFDNYSFINNTDKMLIYAYIQMLMDNYEENPKGKCSFAELLKIQTGRLDTL